MSKNTSDFIAQSMQSILTSDEHQSLFRGRYKKASADEHCDHSEACDHSMAKDKKRELS